MTAVGVPWCRVSQVAAVVWLCVAAPFPAYGQYDWTRHLGPRPTGFELERFGTWDLEPLSLRGMVDRAYYESDLLRSSAVRSIAEVTRVVAADGESVGQVFRRSRSHVDRSGHIKTIEYEDPLTKRVVQRESFTFDENGRLERWSRSRSPSEVLVASITRTQYPGAAPYGMAQTFSYYDDGSLKEWRACITSVNQKLQACDEDYLRLDRSARIVEFGWSGKSVTIERDIEGNASGIEIRNLATNDVEQHEIVLQDGAVIEKKGEVVVGRSFFDDRGRLIQHQSHSAEEREYYTTLTWTYDDEGRVISITKAFDSYSFGRDEDGRIVSVDQTMIPHSIRMKFDAAGRVLDQQPPLFFRRLSPGAGGTESYAYDQAGLLDEIVVRDPEGSHVARTDFTYSYRRSSVRVLSRKGGN
ncbi:MAG: hypothetical protein HKN37_14210 [Rhodothermales bacterium]|nr:hypothetical protein [Rhodothermales bacterium]